MLHYILVGVVGVVGGIGEVFTMVGAGVIVTVLTIYLGGM